ncbi:hypothetical protein [Pseudohalioglobus lutimaris]|uniref:FHA domain-containing protein n=1 Tax=Pseudohalioglobus lutimaris TaxID=1737061 RepID=A0A2N5X1M4_9GAMM|nr:hypothetical protein [Pseudohalioglobus lutimaris]PLW68360.1 hypothetical protein C0039_12515 [Pseudohalioglobus lutimaris]
MSVALLDINDCNLQLWGADSAVQSPGYALLDGSDYRFGNAARSSARLRPRDINNRYWWQLSTEPLQPALGPARHSADLVHAHLQQVHREAGQPNELVLACSGSMQREQLSLLLGIAQHCPFNAVGLVNRSILLSSLYGSPGRLFHLELQLHQALLTIVTNSGSEVSIERVVPLPGCGMLQLQERLVEVAASAFIRQTRFDPRRKAGTEQHLYDALPTALQSLAAQPETNIEINGYRARVSATDMTAAGQRLITAIAEAMGDRQPTDHIIADPLVALLPGLQDSFAQLQVAAADELWRAALRHGDHLVQRDGPVSFVTRLPCLAGDEQQTVAPIEPTLMKPVPVARPSHLLSGAIARPLVDGLRIATGVNVVDGASGWELSDSIAVNGQSAAGGTLLAVGDRITLPEGEALLIEVKS